MIKSIFNTVKFQGNSVFSEQAEVAQKSLMIKIYIQYCEFSAPSVFQDKRKLLKTPECKNVFNTINWATLFFRASAVAQNS